MATLFIFAENIELQTMLKNQVSEHRLSDSGFNIPMLQNIIPQYKSMHTFNLGIRVAAVYNNIPVPCLLLPRSSLAKTPFRMANTLGLIDAGYRGEVKAMVDVLDSHDEITINHGTRYFQVCQYNFLPWDQIIIVDSLEALPRPPDNRGEGGFGSTGH